jgi:hypothetical protein
MKIATESERAYPSIAFMARLVKRYRSVFGASPYGVDRIALVDYAWQLAYRYSRLFQGA